MVAAAAGLDARIIGVLFKQRLVEIGLLHGFLCGGGGDGRGGVEQHFEFTKLVHGNHVARGIEFHGTAAGERNSGENNKEWETRGLEHRAKVETLRTPVGNSALQVSYESACVLLQIGVSKISRNFPAPSRVLHMNDDPPVQNSPTDPLTPVDFTTFMRTYQNMVYSTAARLVGNAAQAEDIAQEVFIKAHERYAELSVSPTAPGWLKTVATNLSLNHLQRYRKRWKFFSEFGRDSGNDSDHADTPAIDFASTENTLASLDQRERQAWVERCLARLPEHQRVPLVLFHFDELSYEEIAQKLGVSLAKIKTDILRARAALAQLLAQSGTAHEPFQN